MKLIDNIKTLFSGQETGFKVVGNNWFARYSNAFEDREGEYFPAKAIDNYIARVDTGVTPAPELWIWHEPIVIGKALTVARIGHFAVAAGYFHETPLGQAAKQYLSTRKAKLSHGFMFEPEAFKDSAYHEYNTFEISILPFDKGVEANAYTNFEVKDMTLTENKRNFLVQMFGEETVDQIESDTEKASKALEERGVRFKDFTDIEALKADDDSKKPRGNNKPDMDDDEDEDKMDDEKALAELYVDLVGDIAEIADGQNTVAKALQLVLQQNKDLKARVDTFEAAQSADKERETELENQVKALQAELDLTPQRASKSDATAIDNDSEENKDLLNNLKEKESGQKDGFLDFALDS